jgi:hypothetical protein
LSLRRFDVEAAGRCSACSDAPLNGGILPLGIAVGGCALGSRKQGLYWARFSTLGFAMFPFPRTGLLLALSLFSFATAAVGQAISSDTGSKQTVTRSDEQFAHYCAETEDVQFVGSNNRIETFGPCRSIAVEGSGNTVAVQTVEKQVSVNGDNNKVTWQPADRPAPVTKIVGKGNTVERAKSQ